MRIRKALSRCIGSMLRAHVVAILLSGYAFAQDVPVFAEGIYPEFSDMTRQKPIPFSRIVGINPDQPSEVLDKNTIEYINEFGVKATLERKNLWGYVDKGTLYLLINKEFHRVTLVGTISHLFVSETVVQPTHYDPYSYGYGYPMYSPSSYESNRLVQYIIDFKTGIILPMELSSVESLLSADSELYSEFAGLKKRKRKQMMLMYIRRFNERNPLSFNTKQ